MNRIKSSDVVKFSNRALELCIDLGSSKEAIQQMKLETFLVISVFEKELEADVLTSAGSIQRFGVHDLQLVEI